MFGKSSRYTMCPVCGHRMKKIDTDEYECPWCINGSDDDDDDDGEGLSVYDAALIWLSRGMDEDDRFGYSEEELERALGKR